MSADTEALLATVREALAFHESVIKSEEGYTETVVLHTSQALAALDSLAAELECVDVIAVREARLDKALVTLRWYAEWRNYRFAAPDSRNQEHDEGACAVFANDSWLGGEPGSRARAAIAEIEGEAT